MQESFLASSKPVAKSIARIVTYRNATSFSKMHFGAIIYWSIEEVTIYLGEKTC